MADKEVKMENNFSLTCELQQYVRDQQKRICSVSDVEDLQETLTSILAVLLQGSFSCPPFSSHGKTFVQEEFSKKYFVRFADILLREPAIGLFSKLDEEGQHNLECFFLKGPASDSFLVLTSAISHTSKLQNLQGIVSLLEKFVKSKRLVDIFVENSEKLGSAQLPYLKQRETQIITVLVSLPERISNKLRLKTISLFYPEKFSIFLAEQILKAMDLIHSNLTGNFHDISFTFLSELLGRICMVGHGRRVLRVLLPSFEKWLAESPLWSRICQRLMTSVPDNLLEPVIENLLKEARNPSTIGKLLGDSVLSNTRLHFLLTTKFLLLRYYPDVQVLSNTVGYLSGCRRRHLLIESLQALFDSWINSSAILHTPYNQHVYISCAIVHIIGYLTKDEHQTHKQELLKKLLIGVQNHLESPEQKVRRLGMIVAECVTAALEPNTEKLSFDYEEDEESKLLKDLSKGLKAEVLLKPLESKSIPVLKHKINSREKSLEEIGKENITEKKNDIDDGDDLKPYDLDEEDTDTGRPPRHLRDCMESLLDSKNGDKFEPALKAVEKIVCSLPGDLEEVCVELIKILLHLQDHFSTDNFIELRQRAMIAITTRCPVPVAKFLTEEFYGANYSIIQRLDVLDVLAASAQQLSQPIEIKQEKNVLKKFLPVGHHSAMDVESIPEWKKVVQERIEKKTRRFGQGSSKDRPKPVANKFSQVAGHFLYPLMRNFDHKQNTLDLLGDDSFVLGRLIYTLGVIVYSARGTPGVQNLGTSLVQFTWALRYHHEPIVRQMLVFALVMVFTSVSFSLLFSGTSGEILEVHNWLKDLMDRDANTDVKRVAVKALMVLEDAFKKEVMPSPVQLTL